MTIKNIIAFSITTIAVLLMTGNCDAFQNRPGPPGGRPPGGPGGPGGPRGGDPMEMLANFPIIKALDSDGDGKISGAEMQAAATNLATLDTNNDGVLDAQEMMPKRGRRGGDRSRGGEGERGRPGESGGRGGEGFAERMMENDVDGDGKISLDEAPERMQRFFERLDSDGDGFLSSEEIMTAGGRGRKGGRGGARGGPGGGGDRGSDGAGQRPRRPASE